MIGTVHDTNNSGKLKIIKDIRNKRRGYYEVEFVETGFTCEANIQNIIKGKVKDHTLCFKKVHEVKEVNLRFKSNTTGYLTVSLIKGEICLVTFDGTGYSRWALYHNVKNGKIRDPYFRSFKGVGYEGEFCKKNNPHWKRARQLWSNMMKRCYSEKDKKGYHGKGVFVDERWLCFANFLEDLPSLKNYDKWLSGNKDGNCKYNLDKDLIVEGNKVYSRELCLFVPESLNKAAINPEKREEVRDVLNM